jgi:hypothetical protein
LPGNHWASGFGRRGGRRAAHRQPAVAAATAAHFPARAARWGGEARRRATTSAREGEGGTTRLATGLRPELVATGAGMPAAAWSAVGGGVCAPGRRGSGAFIATCEPLL